MMTPYAPPPSHWLLPRGDQAKPGEELVAVGAELTAATLLDGYRAGLFPMPLPTGDLGWFSPDPRAIMHPGRFHASRSLRRAAKSFHVSVDMGFREVLNGCADPSRPGGWITLEYTEAYMHLYRLGWAHSVEVWQNDTIVGGVFGVEIGGWFAGESMFRTVSNASKVALWHLTGLLGPDRLLDVQWWTPHLGALGAQRVPRSDYLLMAERARRGPAALSVQHRTPDPAQLVPAPRRTV